MKVVILGAGKQGKALAGLLAKEDGFTHITLADYAVAVAEQAVAELETFAQKFDVTFEAVKVDASNQQDVTKVAQHADVIVNCTIPAFNLPIMKAALEVKAHYLDLYSLPIDVDGKSYEQTIDAQFDLNQEFIDAGVTAIPAIGAIPGVSTLLGIHLIKRFDEVDELTIRWVEYMDTEEYVPTVFPSVLFSHWLGQPGQIYYEDGDLKREELLDTIEHIEFQQPVGQQTLYGEAEPGDMILIPKFADKPVKKLKGRATSAVNGVPLGDVWLSALAKLLAEKNSSDNLIDDLASYLPNAKLNIEDVKEAAFVTQVASIGTKNGSQTKQVIEVLTTHEMANNHIPWGSSGELSTVGTIPLEVIKMLQTGELNEPGVISVASLDTDLIIERMQEYGHEVSNREEAL